MEASEAALVIVFLAVTDLTVLMPVSSLPEQAEKLVARKQRHRIIAAVFVNIFLKLLFFIIAFGIL